MLPDRVSNPGPLTYESGALPIALRGPAAFVVTFLLVDMDISFSFLKVRFYIIFPPFCRRYLVHIF